MAAVGAVCAVGSVGAVSVVGAVGAVSAVEYRLRWRLKLKTDKNNKIIGHANRATACTSNKPGTNGRSHAISNVLHGERRVRGRVALGRFRLCQNSSGKPQVCHGS